MNRKDRKKVILSECADISMGYAFRSAVPYASGSTTLLLRLQEFPRSFVLSTDDFLGIEEGAVPESQLLRSGDLVLRGKGNSHYTVLFRLEGVRAAVSQQYIVIRALAVLPEYLLWFLNQRPAQKYLEAVSAGTMVPQVTVKELGSLPVTLPSVEEQKAISQVFLLEEQERILMKRLETTRERIINEKLLSLVEG